jgi:hypothetical protein
LIEFGVVHSMPDRVTVKTAIHVQGVQAMRPFDRLEDSFYRIALIPSRSAPISIVSALNRSHWRRTDKETTMVAKSTVVAARSEPNKLHAARRAQGWPRINILSQSAELGSRLANPFPLAGQWRPANPTPVGGSIGARSTSVGTIPNFVCARNGRSTAQNYAASWNENHDSLTLIDLVAIAGLFLTTAFFYPAMAWLVLLS